MNHIKTLVALVTVFLLLSCSPARLVGGGTGEETTNGRVSGMVVLSGGGPASHTQVKLLPELFDPLKDSVGVHIDTTDERGSFEFINIDRGIYTIQTKNIDNGTSALLVNVRVMSDSEVPQKLVLQKPGTLKLVLLAELNSSNGYVYIPGTDLYRKILSSSDSVIFDSVPAGKIPSINYAHIGDTVSKIIRFSITVESERLELVENLSWPYCRSIGFNTSITGENVTGSVEQIPLLIRLTADNFNFSQANPQGSDLLFTKTDNTALPYEIERFDRDTGLAEVWVKMDTVFGNNSLQSIQMYWGAQTNTSSGASASSNYVFDTANGFQGVWHMAQLGNVPQTDATANSFYAIPYGMSTGSAVPGIIGVAQAFDGLSSYFRVAASANSALNFPEKTPFTLSAWVYANALDNNFHEIVSKGDHQYGMQLHNINQWEVTEFLNVSGWQTVRSPATAQQWSHIVGVCDGNKEYLYVNGALASDSVLLRDSTGRNESNDVYIGRQANLASRYWNGLIDEVIMANVARKPDWIKLSYVNQKIASKLVEFR